MKPVYLDALDYAWASSLKWWIADGYVQSKKGRLHRLITMAPAGKVVDHIDGDPLNNRRSNLRVCTQSGNQRNRRKTKNPTSSKYKGVWFAKAAAHTAKPWRANLRINGRMTYVGSYPTEIEAARGYDAAAIAHYGAFASLNFPKEAT